MPVGVARSICPGPGDEGREASTISHLFPLYVALAPFHVTLQVIHLPNDGKALSFALKLKNKNKGTNQTQTAKKAATSVNAGPSLWLPAPYLYFGVRRLASVALAEKWKNHAKWSATTRTHDARNRGEVREMNGHEEEKLDR